MGLRRPSVCLSVWCLSVCLMSVNMTPTFLTRYSENGHIVHIQSLGEELLPFYHLGHTDLFCAFYNWKYTSLCFSRERKFSVMIPLRIFLCGLLVITHRKWGKILISPRFQVKMLNYIAAFSTKYRLHANDSNINNSLCYLHKKMCHCVAKIRTDKSNFFHRLVKRSPSRGMIIVRQFRYTWSERPRLGDPVEAYAKREGSGTVKNGPFDIEWRHNIFFRSTFFRFCVLISEDSFLISTFGSLVFFWNECKYKISAFL